MTSNTASDTENELSIKDIILKIKDWLLYLIARWKFILFSGILGGVIFVTFVTFQKVSYRADLSFALQDEKSSGGGLSSALGLASQFGLDLGGGSAGGEFTGDNLLELMKSRSIIEKTLLTEFPILVQNKKITFAD